MEIGVAQRSFEPVTQLANQPPGLSLPFCSFVDPFNTVFPTEILDDVKRLMLACLGVTDKNRNQDSPEGI